MIANICPSLTPEVKYLFTPIIFYLFQSLIYNALIKSLALSLLLFGAKISEVKVTWRRNKSARSTKRKCKLVRVKEQKQRRGRGGNTAPTVSRSCYCFFAPIFALSLSRLRNRKLSVHMRETEKKQQSNDVILCTINIWVNPYTDLQILNFSLLVLK